MSRLYKAYLTAYDPARKARLIDLLSRHGRHDPARVEAMLDHLPARLASHLDLVHAEKLRHHLEAMGAQVQILMEDGQEFILPREKTSETTSADAVPELPRLGLATRLRVLFALTFGSLGVQLGLLLFYLLAVVLLALPSVLLSGGLVTPTSPLPLWDALAHRPLLAVLALLQGVGMMLALAWWQTALLRLPAYYFGEGRWPRVRALAWEALVRTPDVAAANALAMSVPLLWCALVATFAVTLGGQGPLWWGGVAVLAGVGFVALGLLFALVPAVAANEELGPLESIVRGWRLSRGYRLRILGNLLLLVLLLGLMAFLGELLFAGLGWGLAQITPWALLALPALGLILMLAFQSIAMSLIQGLITLFYLESRVRGEDWRPAWLVPLYPEWPNGEDPLTERPLGRGWRTWRDLGLSLVAAALVMALFTWALGRAALSRLPAATPTPANTPSALSRQRPPPGTKGLEARISTGTFFAGETPKFWLRVRLEGIHGLPPQLVPGDLARLTVDSVQAADGREFYDPDSPFEKPFFTQVHLYLEDGAYTGTRTVHLRPGATANQIARIRAHMLLKIPRGVQHGRLQATGVISVGPLQANLVELKGIQAHLVFSGDHPQDHLLGILGERAKGKGTIATISRSWNSGPGRLDYRVRFREPVAAVQVFAAQRVDRLERSFELKWKGQVRLGFRE